ncbi:MAG: hypothetical protein HQK54_07815 [Oligoflexales bacterium]|nr:hypothetical protein [Oligoflexales bacterium]
MNKATENLKYHQEWLENLACLFLDYNHIDKAIALWEALDCVKPGDARVIGSLGYAYLEKQRYEDAVKMGERFLATVQDDKRGKGAGVIYLILSRAYFGLGMTELAKQYMSKHLGEKSESV